jgi:CRISPR-associated exonuclease Cas4
MAGGNSDQHRTLLRSREAFVYRADDETLHWLIGDVVPPELPAHSSLKTIAWPRAGAPLVCRLHARPRIRSFGIAQAEQRSWARIVDLAHRLAAACPVALDAGRPRDRRRA